MLDVVDYLLQSKYISMNDMLLQALDLELQL